MQYGEADTTYKAAGCEAGIHQLVDHFYDIMQASYPVIFSWHPSDNNKSRDKLARFLSGWMGGPRRYKEKYGPINLPHAHAHLVVTLKERDQWLDCMAKAIDRMAYPASLKSYLIEQLTVPAERIRQVSTARAEGTNQLKD
ncbi:group II truncated hemoglobin [Pseudomonadales bacterium]|nr:group II truncated hemoglobin [Pseudomonadales bacterium]